MARFTTLDEYLASIADPTHREQFAGLLRWVGATWPQLECQVKWNQPMFTDHGTFILGFTALTNHITVGPERRTLARFMGDVETLKLVHGAKTFRIGYDEAGQQRDLLRQIVDYTIADKKDVQTFWDKRPVGDGMAQA